MRGGLPAGDGDSEPPIGAGVVVRAATREELRKIAQDPVAFIAALDHPHVTGASLRLPDGSLVPQLPGFRRWIWDGEFCGSIGLRWQPGTADLPPHGLGHIGYAVVPWKRGRGYAKAALALMLPEARERGLPFVELTTDPDNIASQAVILANGGALIERFRKPAAYGSTDALRFRIPLAPASIPPPASPGTRG